MTTQPEAVASALSRQAYRLVPLGSLERHPKNQRRGDVAAIVESIRVNGFFGACGVQASSQLLIWGNHRADAAVIAAERIEAASSGTWVARDEGEARLIESWRSWPERFGRLAELPIIDLDVDDDEAERILLADNATSDKASWDRPALAEQLVSIQERRGTLEGTGFGRPDLEALLLDGRKNGKVLGTIPEHLQGMSDEQLAAPFPWFGGKRRVSKVVWAALGDVTNYVEPFAGSLAVLLGRPGGHAGREIVNDLDGLVANFWRAIRDAPETVARAADWPVLESDLHARALVISERRHELVPRLEGDPGWSDAELAGWWVWGVCASIVDFPPSGPWTRDDQNRLVRSGEPGGIGRGMPSVNASNINRGQPDDRGAWLQEWFGELAHRLRDVVVCSGDWSRVTGDFVTQDAGISGVFLDPPYSAADRSRVYLEEDFDIAHAVRAWAVEVGDDPRRRIVLCGYDGELPTMPDSWRVYAWSGGTPLGGRGENAATRRHRERLWLSPACLDIEAVVAPE